MQYFEVIICFSKHLKGFILIFLLLVLWFLCLCKLLLEVFYPIVYVHTVEQLMFGISFSCVEEIFLLQGSERVRYVPKRDIFKLFLLQRSMKNNHLKLCFNSSCIQRRPFQIQVKVLHSNDTEVRGSESEFLS